MIKRQTKPNALFPERILHHYLNSEFNIALDRLEKSVPAVKTKCHHNGTRFSIIKIQKPTKKGSQKNAASSTEIY
jgi:hypothetical protein